MSIKYIAATAVVFLISAGCFSNVESPNNSNSPAPVSESIQAESGNNGNVNNQAADSEVVSPISRAAERVTKKPFGLKVSPGNSPVQPEKFTGYHAGVDFEAFPEEKDTDVEITAICTGKLATKRITSGYGGLVTQQCTINGQAVTVLYGHIRLSSVAAAIGSELEAGDKVGVLGTGFSAETDNERKHLHLGVVKGHGSEIRGYVQQEAHLKDFLDVSKLY